MPFKVIKPSSETVPAKQPSISAVPEETYLDSLVRNITRTGIRGAEAALDVPIMGAGLLKTLAGLGEQGVQALMGIPESLGVPGVSQALKGVSSFLGKDFELAEPPITQAEQIISKPLSKILPEKYLEPRGVTETFSDQIISDFVPLVMGKVPTKYAALASVLGNVTPFLGKSVGLGEGAQAGIKIGTILGTTMLGSANLKKYAKDLYAKSGLRLSEGETVSARQIKPFLKDLSEMTRGGLKTPTKESLGKIIKNIKSHITPDNEISIQSLISMKQDVNELISDIAMPKRFKKLLPQVSRKLNETIKQYGEINPKFWSEFSQADEIYRNIYRKTFIDNVLKKSPIIKKLSPATIGLLFGAQAMGIPYAATLAKGLGGAYLLSGGLKGMRYLKSPAIRKYYFDVLAQAGKENIPSMTKSLRKLDMAINKKKPDGRFIRVK